MIGQNRDGHGIQDLTETKVESERKSNINKTMYDWFPGKEQKT